MASPTQRAAVGAAPAGQRLRRSVRTLSRQGIKLAAAAVDVVRRPPAGVVVLIYHRVGGGSGLEVDLSVDAFRRQIESLAASGQVLSLDAAVGRLTSTDVDDSPAVVVTFDDGTADFAEHAVPVLVEFGVPVTMYVATAFVDEQRDFPDDGRPLSWAALADVVSTGLVTVGSHTHTHALLDRVAPDVIADELDRSRGLIADRLGVPARHFAYPKAVAGSTEADRAVRERFASAALAGGRANHRGDDVYRLARTPVQVSDRHRWFLNKSRGGMAFEEDLRSLLNRRRYRNLHN